MRVRLRSGEGVVIRRGGVVAVVRGGDAFVDELLDVIDGADVSLVGAEMLRCARRSTDPARALAAAVIGSECDVVVVGDAHCEARGRGGATLTLDGPSPQLLGLDDAPESLAIALGGVGDLVARSDLGDGVTAGAGAEIEVDPGVARGAVVERADAEPSTNAVPLVAGPVVVAPGVALPPPPVPAMPVIETPPPPAPSTSPPVNLLMAVDDDASASVRPPLPATPDEMPPDDDVVMVRGVACSIGHVNRLDALYCSSCGRRLQHTVRLTEGPRPPLGTLIFDDGAAYGLDRRYVIGRDPATDPDAAAGRSGSIRLDDVDRSISRVHAEVRLVDWDVVVVDRGSANGTFVFPPGGTAWTALQPEVPVTIGDGWSVAVGRRTFVYQQR